MLFKNRAGSDGRTSHHRNEEGRMINARIVASVYRRYEEGLWRTEESGFSLDGKLDDL